MKVLVACEFSGIVRDAFLKDGHDAISCDLLPTEKEGPHYQGSVLDILNDGWDLMVAHPPCTYTAVSGARWFKSRIEEQKNAVEFFLTLYNSKIPRIANEHPVSVISTLFRKPDQYIQPWMFGHGETKKTGLWLKNLPKLEPTKIVNGRKNRVHYEPPHKERWRNRSRTYQGVANAMAAQWGNL